MEDIFISFMLIIVLVLIMETPLYIIFCIKKNKTLGKFGEYFVKKKLKELPSEYIILNDIFIKLDKYSSQIDHVVVSDYGVFVIETKKYNGEFIGGEYDKKWLNTKNGKYYDNPINQNYGHVQNLKRLLKLEDNQIFSIICFTGDIKLKEKYDELTDLYTILDKIKSYNKKTITNRQEIVNIIKNNNITNRRIRKDYYKSIKKNNGINICPKCGSELVARNGINGRFVGCSNYPKCKFTKNISNVL